MRAAAAVALVAMMLAGCQLVDAQPEPPRTLAVVAIVDGDTITATTPEGERVRVASWASTRPRWPRMASQPSVEPRMPELP